MEAMQYWYDKLEAESPLNIVFGKGINDMTKI